MPIIIAIEAEEGGVISIPAKTTAPNAHIVPKTIVSKGIIPCFIEAKIMIRMSRIAAKLTEDVSAIVD
jgi:tRNA isopentenyl-2-thiomethyl-A-37 hydroxylase MiaE